ncbi:cytochrome b/b6 domain-containing protein [Sediminicoccus sp. KRV36]|uniref:cytochrome b n=1 Tax=Sediminicoccus sp. KRV36 TaxID=3133721 RepID=UPI00200E6948|nr:cytochrome b/b6 domain-containing protein [Sediminicoccus rosea]UPY35433.1 cytochrome b/b6 domain-containing protein [Sediminicoccus rosea]
MAWLNSPSGYGGLTKAFHWLTVFLFAFQLLSALIMLRLDEHGRVIGLGGSDWYNWHKTLGLVALLVALGRLWARRAGALPDWAPTLTSLDKRVVHRAEQALYVAMFLMPVSGFVFTMAAGYGVQFAGLWPLPNPIGQWEALGEAARRVHVGTAILLGVALAAHLAVVLRHVLLLRDGLLRRMLPGK